MEQIEQLLEELEPIFEKWWLKDPTRDEHLYGIMYGAYEAGYKQAIISKWKEMEDKVDALRKWGDGNQRLYLKSVKRSGALEEENKKLKKQNNYDNNGTFKEGVDPEVTCKNCGSTHLCDCMDATCWKCGKHY